jgi:hypothetical protein
MKQEETTVGVQDTHHRVSFASLSGKPVEATFDGGILTSDSGVMLLREVEARTGILHRMVAALTDRRHQSYVHHQMMDLVKQRVFQMACGYEDANDCNTLREDPGFKAACDRLPLSGADLASQPTMSRFENRITRGDLYRIAKAFADVFIASYKKPPKAILLDIDDTEDKVYGSGQLSLFNAYFKSHCYQPLHIYEGQTGRLITTILRPGVPACCRQAAFWQRDRFDSQTGDRLPAPRLARRGDPVAWRFSFFVSGSSRVV